MPNGGKFLLLCWKSEFTWLIQSKHQRASIMFHARNKHPRVRHQSELSWFYQLLFFLHLPLETLLPLCTDKPYLTWSRSVFQDKIKETITPHKLTALKSFAEVATPIGLTAAGCWAPETSTFVLRKLLLPTSKKGGIVHPSQMWLLSTLSKAFRV